MGGYVDVPDEPQILNLREGGLDFSQPADQLSEGMSPYALDVRFDYGGVSPDFGISPFDAPSASAANKTIMKLAPFELATETKFMMRLRPTKWDRWDGTSWLELGGTLTGGVTDKLMAANYGDFFVAANGVDKLKYWTGSDGFSVADLSADSPIATYLIKVGNRLVAGRIKRAGVIFPYDLMWSGDGFPQDWTTATNGAGGNTLGPEGSNRATNKITGMSTLEGAGVVYRQRTIVMMLQTGIGAAPFRFITTDFGHGTLSPYSIANGGMKTGDYFLGDDFMVYFFDGRSLPVPIGDPIVKVLKSAIYDPRYVVGCVDGRNQEFVLGYPTDSSLLIKKAYAFSISEWVKSNRLVWRHRLLGDGYTTIDFGAVPTTTDPFIDDVSDFVDTVPERVNDFAATLGDERLLFGDTVGQASFLDLTVTLTSGIWVSKSLGDAQTEISVNRLRVQASCSAVAQVEVSLSIDGLNFLYPIVFDIPITGQGTVLVADYMGAIVEKSAYQFQIRILSGNCVVSQLSYTVANHGPTA